MKESTSFDLPPAPARAIIRNGPRCKLRRVPTVLFAYHVIFFGFLAIVTELMFDVHTYGRFRENERQNEIINDGITERRSQDYTFFLTEVDYLMIKIIYEISERCLCLNNK